MQKARSHPVTASCDMRLPQNVGTRFQVLFHSPPGVLFTFPSRYLCTIGYRVVFSLGRWSFRIHTGFHVPRATRETVPGRHSPFRIRGYHPLWPNFPDRSPMDMLDNSPKDPQCPPDCPHNPDYATPAGLHATGLGSSHFARRYFGNLS